MLLHIWPKTSNLYVLEYHGYQVTQHEGDGEFHRVHNNGQEILEFVCVFDGQREH